MSWLILACAHVSPGFPGSGEGKTMFIRRIFRDLSSFSLLIFFKKKKQKQNIRQRAEI